MIMAGTRNPQTSVRRPKGSVRVQTMPGSTRSAPGQSAVVRYVGQPALRAYTLWVTGVQDKNKSVVSVLGRAVGGAIGTGLLFGVVGAVIPGLTFKGAAKVGAVVGAASSVALDVGGRRT